MFTVGDLKDFFKSTSLPNKTPIAIDDSEVVSYNKCVGGGIYDKIGDYLSLKTNRENPAVLYNEIAEFYDKKKIGINGLWALHFFIKVWLNKRHKELCNRGSCEGNHSPLEIDISELEEKTKRFLPVEIFDLYKGECPNKNEVVFVFDEVERGWSESEWMEDKKNEYKFASNGEFVNILFNHRWMRLPQLED